MIIWPFDKAMCCTESCARMHGLVNCAVEEAIWADLKQLAVVQTFI